MNRAKYNWISAWKNKPIISSRLLCAVKKKKKNISPKFCEFHHSQHAQSSHCPFVLTLQNSTNTNSYCVEIHNKKGRKPTSWQKISEESFPLSKHSSDILWISSSQHKASIVLADVTGLWNSHNGSTQGSYCIEPSANTPLPVHSYTHSSYCAHSTGYDRKVLLPLFAKRIVFSALWNCPTIYNRIFCEYHLIGRN